MATKRLTKEEKLFEAKVNESSKKVLNCLQVPIFELSTLDSYVRNLVKASGQSLNEDEVKLVRLYAVTKCGAKESNALDPHPTLHVGECMTSKSNMAEATAKLLAFMGRTHGCEVTTKEVTRNLFRQKEVVQREVRWQKEVVRREVTWSKDTVRAGKQEHTFFIYEGMSNPNEQTELLKSAQRKLDIIFGYLPHPSV